MRKAPIVGSGLIIILAIAIVISIKTNVSSPTASEVAATTGDGRSPDAVRREDAHPSAAIAPVDKIAPSSDLHSEFRNSKDLWEFAKSLLNRARAGDGNAQYYLYAALSECESLDNMYFKTSAGNGARRTLDEALQIAVKMGGYNFEDVTGFYERCRKFIGPQDHPFGQANEWLRAASDGGIAIAQAQMALMKAIESRNAPTEADRNEARTETRRLMTEALKKKEPSAMVVVGDAAMALTGFDEIAKAHHEWVWLLAACKRGLDCSPESEWYHLHCRVDPACQPFETGVIDVVKRLTGARFDELDRSASDLNAAIDASRFDELHL